MQTTRNCRVRLYSCLCVLILCAALGASHAQVYPPGTAYAAGSVYPSTSVLAGNIAGGYFGNGGGSVFDLAVTNSTGGGGAMLTIFTGNGDGTFTATASYTFAGSSIKDGLSTILAGPLTGVGKVDLVASDDQSNLFLIPGNGDGTFGNPVALNQVGYTLQVFPNPNGTLNLLTTSLTYSSTLKETLSTVSVLTNNGSGSFTAQTILSNSAWQVSEADYLNIAGTPTILLIGIDGTARISSYASGSYAAPVTFNLNMPSGAGVLGGVVSFVLNGNTGFAGLANGSLYVWIGSSNGTFQTPYSENWTPYSPVQLATADLNGDGYTDIVLLGGGAFSGVQNIIPLYGNSTGSFSAEFRTGPGVYGSQLVIGDANGDGHPDLILMEQNQGITTLLNQGDGSFPHPPTYTALPQTVSSQPTADFPVGLATADLNGDGIGDLVTVNGINPSTYVNTNTISSFSSDTNGGFTYQGDFAVGNQPIGIALAPVNGHVSAFVANRLDGNLSFLQGNGDGTFAAQQTFTGGSLSSSSYPLAIVAGTIDTSGYPGVIVGDSSGGITVFAGSSSGWTASHQYTTGTGAGAISSMALIDINQDGNLDLLVGVGATCGYNSSYQYTLTNGNVLVFPGVGDGSFASAVPVTSSQSNWNPGFVTAGSLTGGRYLDLVALNNNKNTCPTGLLVNPKGIAIFSGTSLATLQETDLDSPLANVTFSPGTEFGQYGPVFAAVADANADGINDLIISGGGLVGVLPGQGAGLFGAPVVQVATSNSSGLVTGSFYSAGSAATGHDVAVAGSQGVAVLQSLLGKSGGTAGSPYASFSPTSLNFGSVTPGQTESQTLTLQNTGTATLSVPMDTILTGSGSFSHVYSTSTLCGTVANPPSITIAPGQNCAITITFAPTAGGDDTSSFVFQDNAQQSNVTSTQIGTSTFYSQTISLIGSAPIITIQISPGTVPAGTVNSFYAQTFSAIGGTGNYTFTETGTLPMGITLNGPTLSGTPVQAGTFPITITATDSSGTSSSESFQLVINCPTLTITPAGQLLPVASLGILYDQAFFVSGTTGAFSWSINGTLPSGLQFTGGTSNGPVVVGTPAPPTGDYSFTLSVKDSVGCVVGNNYLLLVSAPLTLTPILPAGNVGVPYSGSITASGGTPPYTYIIFPTPPGMTFNAQTGALTGTPTQTGTYTLVVGATDVNGVQGLISVPWTVLGLVQIPPVTETIYLSDSIPTPSVTGMVAPTLSWATPASIAFGTALGATQLDAVSSVPGTFSYAPPAGTVLPIGSTQLTATFTPQDTAHYTTASVTVEQLVTAYAFTVSANPPSLTLKAGQTGKATFTITPLGGFKGTITPSCGGIPATVSCSFNPVSVTADGSDTPLTTVMTVVTEGPTTGTAANTLLPRMVWLASVCMLPGVFGGIVLFRQRRWGKPALSILCLSTLAIAITAAMMGCGGYSGPRTVAGTYTFSVTISASGTAAGSADPVPFTLIVEQ